MCIQYECYNCGSDLEDENSLRLCFSYEQTLGLMFGNVQNCPNYVRAKASASTWCAFCSAIDASAAESFPEPISFAIDHTDFLSRPSASAATLVTSALPSGLTGTDAALAYRTSETGRQISTDTEGKALLSHNSGLRPLLPKLLAGHHAVHSPAPPPLSLQNPRSADRDGVTNEAGMAAYSAEPLDLAQRGESGVDSVREARITRGSTRLQSKKRQISGVEAFASPNPKASVHRVQKTGNCKAKGPRTAVACENCKHSRMKCSGEVPSCDRCLRKGEQCLGYSAPESMKKRRRAAAARGSSYNILTDQPLPIPEDHSTDYQVLAPQNDASRTRVGEDLQQNVTINNTVSRNEVGTDSMAAQRNYLLSLFRYLDEPQENEQGQKDEKHH